MDFEKNRPFSIKNTARNQDWLCKNYFISDKDKNHDKHTYKNKLSVELSNLFYYR